MRHTGAGGFARSSTLQVNILLFGKILDLFIKVIGFDTNGSENSFGANVVIAMTANVGDLDVVAFSRSNAGCQFFGLDARNNVIRAVFSELPQSIDDVDQDRQAENNLHRAARGIEPVQDGGECIAKDVSEQ